MNSSPETMHMMIPARPETMHMIESPKHTKIPEMGHVRCRSGMEREESSIQIITFDA